MGIMRWLEDQIIQTEQTIQYTILKVTPIPKIPRDPEISQPTLCALSELYLSILLSILMCTQIQSLHSLCLNGKGTTPRKVLAITCCHLGCSNHTSRDLHGWWSYLELLPCCPHFLSEFYQLQIHSQPYCACPVVLDVSPSGGIW